MKDNNVLEARARVMAAMKSYGPLAERLFGSTLVSMTSRWSFVDLVGVFSTSLQLACVRACPGRPEGVEYDVYKMRTATR